MAKYFNKNDDAEKALAVCLRSAQAIPCHPPDYFQGLPDPFLNLPKNLLLFRRDAPMQGEAPSAHHRALLIFCLEGEGSVIVDDAALRLQPGRVLLVAPFQFHHYADFSDGRLLWIYLSFEMEDGVTLSSLRGRTHPMSEFQLTCLAQLMSSYSGPASRRTSTASLTLLAALLLETLQAASAREAHRNPTTRSLVHEVAAYVHQNASGPISVPEVARAVGISESHLRARFRELVGVGVGAYIQRFRIHQARTLLHSSSLSMNGIAARCGYESIYSFSRAFRREMGMSASDYRRSLKAS